jgi:hypothetical protein
MTSRPVGSAITAMWAWDNPVSPADDPRGRGYAPAAADRLASFARAGGLREVHVLAPSGIAPGQVDAWLGDAVTALHDGGLSVSAVAGVRGATVRWVRAVSEVAAFDRLQVAVMPWAPPGEGRTPEEVGRSVVDAVGVVVGETALPVDVCVPWWFATEAGPDGGTLLGSLVTLVDRVALAVPAAQAEGPGGVLELAEPGVQALAGAGRPFTIGVQTDPPELAGGADRTFFDEGPVGFIRGCGAIGAALADVPGFDGVAVKAHRAWRRLLGV